MTLDVDRLIELAERIEGYDPKVSPDNRADELALHQDIVMATGEGSLTCDFDRTFVRSLDAALSLVPEGMGYGVAEPRNGVEPSGLIFNSTGLSIEARAATPALALCAAAIRAMSAAEQKDASI